MELTRKLQLGGLQAKGGTQMLVALVPMTHSVLGGYVLLHMRTAQDAGKL